MKNEKKLIILILAGLAAGCASAEIDKAFEGKYDSFRETAVITDYCQSCHVHRKFNPSTHLSEKPFLFKKPPYSSASDCKTCHEIKRNVWNEIVKRTHFPDGAIVETP